MSSKDYLSLIKKRYMGSQNRSGNELSFEVLENKYSRHVFDSNDFKDKVVLEIGGGFSNYVNLFFHYGAKKVYANDLIPGRFSKNLKNNSNYISICDDFLEIKLPEKVDIVFTSLTLMFLVPSHPKVFEKIDKILKKDGLVIFFEPNYLSIISIFRRFLDFKPNPAKLFSSFSIKSFFKNKNYNILHHKPIIHEKYSFLNSWFISTNFWFKAKKTNK